MFRRRALKRKLHRVIARFREKGATSPEKAMTVEELGLPPKFKEAVKRPFLARLNIFVEANGKYYLSEERLKSLKGTFGIGEGGKFQESDWVSCEYCDSLMPPDSVKCPNCGAPRKKKN